MNNLEKAKELKEEKKVWTSAYGCDNLNNDNYDLWFKNIKQKTKELLEKTEKELKEIGLSLNVNTPQLKETIKICKEILE